MFRRFSLASIALSLVLLAQVPIASAQLNWSIAQREPQEITTFVERVLAAEGNAPGAEEAPAVVLYHQIFADMKVGSMEICRNWILKINDPSALVERVLHPYTDSSGQFVSMGAFRYRDGKLRQLYGRELKTLPPEPPRRGQALFQWVDIKPGDVIGASIITSYDEHFSVAHMPAVSVVPVVRSNLRVRSDGSNTYTILGHRGEDYDFNLDVEGSINDEASEWSASMNYLPAYPDLPLSPPYPVELPAFTVVQLAKYTTMPGISRGWWSTLGWRQVALRLAQIEDESAAYGVEITGKAQEIAGDLTTDAEKEAAVFDFVKNQVKSLRGYEYDPRSVRKPSLVLAEMGGTDWEKLMLMLSLLQELGIDGQLAGVRTQPWGALDESLPGFQNFQELALRFGGEEGRWYAPHADDAVAGTLPASWGTCITLAPKPGLMEEAAKFNEVAQRKIIEQANEDITTVTPELIQERIDAALADAGWYKIETVKPN